MKTTSARQALVWGGVLILVGALALLNQVVELSAWVWIAFLALAGLGSLGLYLTDRSDWAMLITAYVLLAIALLVALATLSIVPGGIIAVYVLVAISLPFLAVYYRDRAQWWALIPAYVLLAIGLMLGLIELGILDDLIIPAYVLFAIAIPFFVVYARDRKLWWALIPGVILALIGLILLVAEAAFVYIGGLMLILVGVGVLARVFTHKEPGPDASTPSGLEIDEPPLE